MDEGMNGGMNEGMSHAGPYCKSLKPVMKSGEGVVGPGACCIVTGPSKTTWMMYHSWNLQRTYRAMSIAEVSWDQHGPIVNAIWGKPQPTPFV